MIVVAASVIVGSTPFGPGADLLVENCLECIEHRSGGVDEVTRRTDEVLDRTIRVDRPVVIGTNSSGTGSTCPE